MATDHILELADRYGAAADFTRRQVSWRVFGDTNKLDALAEGGDLTTRRYAAAIAFFSDNWPEGADWPASVQRPPQDQPGSEIIGGEGAALGHDGETAADGRSGHAISADAALRAEVGR